MIEFNEEQQAVIRQLGEKFTFGLSNIKCSVSAYLDDEATLKRDELVDRAKELGQIVQKYVYGAVPIGVHGDTKALYERNGRALTLTDDAANWLAKNT